MFQDERPCIPVPGANVNDGAVFTIYARPEEGQKRRYSVAGSSYVSVVEFGPEVRALSVHTFGASGHPENRHYIDQAALYSRGEFKPAWLTLKDIRANMEAEYHPGGESRQSANSPLHRTAGLNLFSGSAAPRTLLTPHAGTRSN